METQRAPSGGEGVLRAGFATVDITPPVGIHLGGYASRTSPSLAVGQPLYAKAMALSCGGTTVSVVATDLLFITALLARGIRALVRQRVAIPEDHVLLSATHTHSGPLLEHMSMVEEEVVDEGWIENVLIGKIADSVCLANGCMRPARIGTGSTEIHGLTFNRRPRRQDGRVEAAHNLFTWDGPVSFEALEFGPVDPDLGVFSVYDFEDRLLGSMVNFSCHPVCNDYGPRTISSDYPGLATQVIEEATRATCLFTTAPSAEVNPAVRNGSHMKAVLSRQALSVLETIEPFGCEGLWAGSRRINLPLKAFPTVEEARRRFEKELAEESPDRFLCRRDLMYAEQYEGRTDLETEIQVVGVGDILLIGLPGEVSVEIGLLMKEEVASRFGKRFVFAITQANDWTGETIPDRAYGEGGSEPRTTRLGPGSADAMLEGVLELLDAALG